MRLSTILKVVGMLVVAVIVGGVIVIMSTDYNQYEGLIAEKVKQATGRNSSIAGDIELELSFTPSLSVSGVRFENAEWGSKPICFLSKNFRLKSRCCRYCRIRSKWIMSCCKGRRF